MTKIKPNIYENLTIKQRVVATFEAMARGDMSEKAKLVSTCPKKTYTQTDAAFSDRMEILADLTLAIECDMRGHALNYLYAKDVFAEEVATTQLRTLISLRAAWHEILAQEGIDPKVMDKIYGDLEHPALKELFMIEQDLDPIPETIELCKKESKRLLGD